MHGYFLVFNKPPWALPVILAVHRHKTTNGWFFLELYLYCNAVITFRTYNKPVLLIAIKPKPMWMLE